MDKKEKYMKLFETLPPDEQRQHLVVAILYALGVTVPGKITVDNIQGDSDVDDARQSHCDAVANDLLADVDI